MAMEKNGLIRKLKVNFRIMMSQFGQQAIMINILPDISNSKGS